MLEVRYTLVWSGNEITEVEVDILLGNLTLVGRKGASLRQFFHTEFVHRNLASVVEKRSGNPGYEVDRPLVFGLVGAGGEMEQTPGVRVWGANQHSSRCTTNPGAALEFGTDLVSGCLVRLAREQVREQDEDYEGEDEHEDDMSWL